MYARGGLQPHIIEAPKWLGGLGEKNSNNGTQYYQQDRVYSSEGYAMCLPSGLPGGSYKYAIKESNVINKLDDNSNQRNVVYDTNKNAPTLQSAMGTGGGNTPLIIQEDINTKGKKQECASTILAGYERTNMTGFNADNGVMETVKIKQATKKGYVECEVGGVADLSYVSSTTRRGRVQDNGQVSPTLTVADIEGIKRIEKVGNISSEGSQCGTVVSDNGLMGTLSAGTHGYGNNHILSQYRIRKLTPKECWRLMGFTDEEFEKAAAVNSNTQLYKQAGNSIVVDVLVAIFSEMINSLEDKTPKYQHMEQMSLFDYV